MAVFEGSISFNPMLESYLQDRLTNKVLVVVCHTLRC